MTPKGHQGQGSDPQSNLELKDSEAARGLCLESKTVKSMFVRPDYHSTQWMSDVPAMIGNALLITVLSVNAS